MMPSSSSRSWPSSFSLVTYAGSWSRSARSTVETAIQDYESQSSPDTVSPTVPPWVCQCLQVDGERWYFARRHRASGVLTAQSADELARRIREEPPVPAAHPVAQPIHWPRGESV